MPKVSVLMPIYKTPPEYLKMSIESILAQTYKDFEFLILDDCPKENREDFVKSYKDSRIRYIKNDYNMGISASRNKLLELATGEYLAIFDHDDISLPNRLEKEVAYLDANPDVGVVSSNVKFMIKNKITKYPTENSAIKTELINSCVVKHTAALIRKSVLQENNIRYEAAYSPAEDYMLWIRLLGKTMFHNLPNVLVQYRDSAENTSHRQEEKMKDRDMMIKSIAHKEYPYLNEIGVKTISLFNILPLLKIKTTGHKILYLLFGVIPLLQIIKKAK